MDNLPKPNLTGLNLEQVKQNRQKYGANVDRTHDFTTLKIIFKTIFSVFNIIMVILIIVMIVINQGSTAKFIGIVAAINALIELIQEIRARLIVKKLDKITQKTTKVLRDGKEVEIPVSELVIEDLVHLSSGDRVPVDGQMVSSEYAEFDESILTGESKYIQKKTDEPVLAGSIIAAGSCYYRMTKLSKDSYIQTLTKQLKQFSVAESPLQSQINQIIKALTYMTLFFIVLMVAEGLIQENQVEEIIINSATLITSLVPQGLVLITTISFAYGAMKIAKNQAIVQRLSAIEAMANTKVVCMDKTGTLTKNILEVKEVKWL
jgi:cation-transporting ATPase E